MLKINLHLVAITTNANIKLKLKSLVKKGWKKLPYLRRKVSQEFKRAPWLDIVLVLASVGLGLLVFHKVNVGHLPFDTNSVLSNLLVINGVFSAVLMTFLFSRIGWAKDRKYDTAKEAMDISQKITEFRRILYILTRYYGVWIEQDKRTKSLLEHGKYSSIEFWEVESIYSPGKLGKKEKLVQELMKDEDFDSGLSVLYLAMLSLVYLRGREQFSFQSELYHEFDIKKVYSLEVVEKWIDYSCFGKIWYWMNYDVHWINYSHLNAAEQNRIKEAAVRIDPKFANRELDNDLIEDITTAFNSYYLDELRERLLMLKSGNRSLNLLMTILICCSLFFGVLLPLILLLLFSADAQFREYVAAIASINAGIIFYLTLKFPFLINKELRFI